MIKDFDDIVHTAFGLRLTPRQMQNLTVYVSLLRDWSSRVRLISKGDREHIWERHILDCLSVVSFLPSSGQIMDFGSGAGLPGIPVAIALNDLQVQLLEPARMKALFLNQVVQDLGLANVEIVRARSEELEQDPIYQDQSECIVARAVTALPNLWKLVCPLLSPSGRLVSLKGPNVEEELVGFSQAEINIEIETFTLPLTNRERAVVTLRNVSRETPI